MHFSLEPGISSIVKFEWDHIHLCVYLYLFRVLLFNLCCNGRRKNRDRIFSDILSESMKPKNPLTTFLIIIISIFLMVISGIIETYYLYK